MTQDVRAQPTAPEPDPQQEEPRRPEPGGWHTTIRSITEGSALGAVLAVLLAVVVGSLLILLTDEQVRGTASYFFSRPGDFLRACTDAVGGAYSALFRGAIYNTRVDDPVTAIRPLTETLKFAGPLIAAGLGVGLAFRAGLFNIGGRGQMLIAGAAAGWVATGVGVTGPLLLVLSVVAGLVGGAVWGGLVGLLKARTGAHEVIVTIMLNYVAVYLVFFAVSRQSLLQAPGSAQARSAPMPSDAVLPDLLGVRFDLHAGFLLALVAVALVWWLVNRSSFGFRFRAVGENAHAARAAGIDVGRVYITVMAISGALVGLAGVNQVLGTVTTGVDQGLDAGIGFDAITVALLGRSHPLGILGAGLLFGAFKAGGFAMQASEGIPIDIVLVVQSLIVLFLAAPPLVRAIFRLPTKADA